MRLRRSRCAEPSEGTVRYIFDQPSRLERYADDAPYAHFVAKCWASPGRDRFANFGHPLQSNVEDCQRPRTTRMIAVMIERMKQSQRRVATDYHRLVTHLIV